MYSQGISNLWLLGYFSNPTYYTQGGTTIDFYSGFPDTSHTNRTMNMDDCDASISDSAGNLLFYTNGVYIANANNDTLLDGDSLNPAPYTFQNSVTGLRVPQGALILPKPGSSNIYYLFHETRYYLPSLPIYYEPLELYYTIVDMNLDNGLGGVVQKNIVLLSDTLNNGAITACRHANGRDWWIVFHRYSGTTYFKFLFTPSGLQGPFTQDIGCSIDSNWIWQSCFSPDGSKFASITGRDTLDIMEFDRCNGKFFNVRSSNINDQSFARGVAFSPNSKYVYVSSTSFIYQFDSDLSNLDSGKILVAIYNGFAEPGLPFRSYFYQAQLANNGKIYICSTNSCPCLHVINDPNQQGLSCNILQHGLVLPTENSSTIPNYPNYFLGAESGSVCDSLIMSTENINIGDINIYPSPANNYLFIKNKSENVITDINIVNTLGQKILIDYFKIDRNNFQLDISGINNGIYFITVNYKDYNETKSFIKYQTR